jgi:hypothetical protein
MLKNAISEEPGGEAGLGVVALLTVDQELAEFQPRVGVPVPSQKMLVAGARAGDKAQVKNAPQTSNIRSAKDRIMVSFRLFSAAGQIRHGTILTHPDSGHKEIRIKPYCRPFEISQWRRIDG